MTDPPRPPHYFHENPTGPVREGHVTLVVGGREFEFTTATGVFSKDKVDTGSQALLGQFLKRVDVGERTLLDLGCGYGVVGIVIATLFPLSKVHLVEVNARALRYAKINAKAHGVDNCVFHQGDFMDEDIVNAIGGENVDFVLFNPPVKAGKETIQQMTLRARQLLSPTGSMYIVIKKSLGAESFKAWLSSSLHRDISVVKKGGYHVLMVVPSSLS